MSAVVCADEKTLRKRIWPIIDALAQMAVDTVSRLLVVAVVVVVVVLSSSFSLLTRRIAMLLLSLLLRRLN